MFKSNINTGSTITLMILVMMSYSAHAATPESVLKHYADLAHVMYSDALLTAEELENNIDTFLAKPEEENLAATKTAWIAARVPYMQTEAYRFGNAIVDDWEGNVNAWPLDEGLIDYTASSYGTESEENPFYVKDIQANWKIVAENYIDQYHLAQLHSGTLNMYDHANAQFGWSGHFCVRSGCHVWLGDFPIGRL